MPDDGLRSSTTATVRLHDVTLQPRRDFDVTHWFYADALIDWYKTDLFDERFWKIVAPYMRDVADHGQDTLYVPAFTPPLDGVKRPSQLLDVDAHRRRTPTASTGGTSSATSIWPRQSGITHFEWCHFFTQWGAKNAIRIYEGQGRDEKLLWSPETAATSETYRALPRRSSCPSCTASWKRRHPRRAPSSTSPTSRTPNTCRNTETTARCCRNSPRGCR